MKSIIAQTKNNKNFLAMLSPPFILYGFFQKEIMQIVSKNNLYQRIKNFNQLIDNINKIPLGNLFLKHMLKKDISNSYEDLRGINIIPA